MHYFITGGTGSLGRALVKRLSENLALSITVYSRDEGKQNQYFANEPRVKCVIGDVRDFSALNKAIQSASKSAYSSDGSENELVIIHAAALKRIDDLENFPEECIKTNVQGSINVVEAAKENNVKTCVLVSTDKACLPANTYGASKFLAERVFTTAAKENGIFCCVRYGNVIASRGSFIPLWQSLIRENREVPITDETCSRFLFTLQDAVSLILYACENTEERGEIYVPNIKAYNIVDVLRALAIIENKDFAQIKIKNIGVRPGEKLHEDMIAVTECGRTYAPYENYGVYRIWPQWSYSGKPMDRVKPMNTADSKPYSIDELVNLIKRGLNEVV